MSPDDKITLLFNGFLQLRNLEKLKLVEAINEYFDSNEREEIRRQNDERFASLMADDDKFECIACGR